MTKRRIVIRELAPLLVIAALAVGVLWRVTLAGKAMVPGDLLLLMEPWRRHSREFPEFKRVGNPILDAIQQFYPWRKYAGENLRRGVIPLWNPHELCGNPFVGNNQSAVFYPETWLHALMPTERALGWATALHFLASGGLMYWFLRVLKLGRPAALIGAIAFMFNGFVVGWLCFPSFRSVPAWLPGMLASFELALQRRSWPWLAVCALCVGLQFLAGNLHISLLVLIVFAGYVMFRCVAEYVRGERGPALALAAGGVVAVGAGAALAAIQLLPALETAGMSSRIGGMSYAEIIRHATPLPQLLAALMPDLFGNPADGNHWGANLGPIYRAYTETAWYVGVLPLLAAPAAFLARSRSMGWFWAAMAIVGIALAMGTPLYALVYYAVPAAKALPGVGRAILIAGTSLSVLGAIGIDVLLRGSRGDPPFNLAKYTAIVAVCLGLIGLIGGGWAWITTGALEQAMPGIGGYTAHQIARFAAILAVAVTLIVLLPLRRRLVAIALVALISADMYVFVDKFTPATPPGYLHIATRTVDLVRQDPEPARLLSLGPDAVRRMAPNTPMIVGLEDIQGSDSLDVGAYRRLLGGLLSEELGFPQPDPSLPAIDLLGVKYMHSAVDLGEVHGLSLLSRAEGWLYRNDEALPRAFTVPDYEVVAGHEQALSSVTARDFDPAQNAVFVGGDRPGNHVVSSLPVTRASVAYRGPNRATITGQFQPGQVLLLTDTYYPGWRAFQGGRECRVMRANYALRAVEIEQPCARVEFVYTPTSLRAGAFLSLCGIGLLAGAAGFALTRRTGGKR